MMDRFRFECERFSLDRVAVDQETRGDVLKAYERAHLHYFWELKVFFRDHPGSLPEIILTPPQTVHSALPRNWLTKGWVLHLQQPEIYAVFHGDPLLDIHIPYDTVEEHCPGEIIKLIQQVVDCLSQNLSVINRQKKINALLELLWSALLIASETDEEAGQGQKRSITSKAREFIERNYYQSDLMTQDVAAYLGVTAGHLANLFKTEGFGTMRQYLVKTRLSNALRLLRTGRYSVKEAAMMTGWNCQFYFSNCFRRNFGVNPSHAHQLPYYRFHSEKT